MHIHHSPWKMGCRSSRVTEGKYPGINSARRKESRFKKLHFLERESQDWGWAAESGGNRWPCVPAARHKVVRGWEPWKSCPPSKIQPSLQDPPPSPWSPPDPSPRSPSAGSTLLPRGNTSAIPGPHGRPLGTAPPHQVPNPTSAMATSTQWRYSGVRCLCLR